MLPGVELARRRRVHYHGDAALEHQHHQYAHGHRAGAAAAVAGPALAARIRLEEKLRGAALPPATSPSRWSRLMGEREAPRRATSGRRSRQDHHQQQQADGGLQATAGAGAERWPPPPATASASAAAASGHRRAELTRTLSMVDVCAVCLEEVRERVTRLPCSHKYHSDCVLPWLAIQPDCPCCRALVPAADAL